MNLKETDLENVESISLAQDMNDRRALVNKVMNLRVPQKAGDFFSSWTHY
jgi:hypothetical protein